MYQGMGKKKAQEGHIPEGMQNKECRQAVAVGRHWSNGTGRTGRMIQTSHKEGMKGTGGGGGEVGRCGGIIPGGGNGHRRHRQKAYRTSSFQ